MNYLQPAEYAQFGLDEETGEDLVAAASAMVDAFCHRPGLDVRQYTERLRFARRGGAVRLSHLPLVATTAMRVRWSRRGEAMGNPLCEAARAFGITGSWSDVDVFTLDISPQGEVTVALRRGLR